jgi:zinc transport system permease protein
LILGVIFKELVFITFDEEVARISGLPIKKINTALAVLTALTVSISMRIVGILMVSALMVIPVAASLQISNSFHRTLVNAIIISEISVFVGLTISFYFNFASGGTIVITAAALFLIAFVLKQVIMEKISKAKILQRPAG